MPSERHCAHSRVALAAREEHKGIKEENSEAEGRVGQQELWKEGSGKVKRKEKEEERGVGESRGKMKGQNERE